MASPYEMQGRKRKKGNAEKYDNEVEEQDPETAVEDAEEEEEEGGNGAESTEMKNTQVKEMKSVEIGTDLPSFPPVSLGQNSINRPGDRISKLPDDILVDILSTLELREAAKTSVLSRRWLNLWTLVPRLRFDATEDQREYCPLEELGEYRSVLVSWVNRVLGLHKSSNLREFGIFGSLDKHSQNEIDKWLEYAFGKGVQRLELNFSLHFVKDLENYNGYVFPNQLLEQIAPPVGFSCVRALHFSVVNISGEAIQGLLCKCPLLEELRVICSIALVDLVVSGPSLMLKHLQITRCSRFESITISNTNIVSFRVSIRDEGKLLLNNLPMLTEVWIYGRFSNKSIFLSRLACCLSQLTVLTLQAKSPKAILELYKFPELKNLRRLVLVVPYCIVMSLIGLTSLIDSCLRLEEFALVLRGHPRFVDISNIEQKKATKQSLKGLKVFELHGCRALDPYVTSVSEMILANASEMILAFASEMIMFFIENAVALEKIVMDPQFITTRHGVEPIETKQAERSRRHAIENFKGVVPKHVQLVIC